MTMTINSPVFQHNEMMPALYTCEGENISPPLAWTAPPEGTKSLVLIADDPDAPDPAAPENDLGSLGFIQSSARCGNVA